MALRFSYEIISYGIVVTTMLFTRKTYWFMDTNRKFPSKKYKEPNGFLLLQKKISRPTRKAFIVNLKCSLIKHTYVTRANVTKYVQQLQHDKFDDKSKRKKQSTIVMCARSSLLSRFSLPYRSLRSSSVRSHERRKYSIISNSNQVVQSV